jgi:transketolase
MTENNSTFLAIGVRKKILKMASKSNKPSHLGGSLSIVDILAVIYSNFIETSSESVEGRDLLILSKGHAALALYATLGEKKIIGESILNSYMTHGSELIAHPIRNLEYGIESSNGSLGHGLSFAAGKALALKMREKSYRVFVILGDGECNEGAVWEAAMFAGSNKISNLFVIVDQNDLQSDGELIDTSNVDQILQRWRSFGWEANSVDGHDHFALEAEFSKFSSEKPKVLIALTKKGYGVDFMENNNDWHHAILTEGKLKEALSYIEKFTK